MNIIKKGFKREYIKPSIVMFAMSNEEYLLAAKRLISQMKSSEPARRLPMLHP